MSRRRHTRSTALLSKCIMEALEQRRLLSGYVPAPRDVDGLSDTAIGADGGLTGRENLSESDIRYADGAAAVVAQDLISHGYGMPFGQTRTWSNANATELGPLGYGWVIPQRPYVKQIDGNNELAVVTGGRTRHHFTYDDSGGGIDYYLATSFDPANLTANTSSDEIIYVDSTGTTLTFFDFTVSPSGKRGQLKSITDAGGNTTTVSYTSDKITEIQRSSGGADIESWVYSYIGEGDNAGLLDHVTLRRSYNSGGNWTTIRQVAYTYYADSDAHGSAKDLKTAQVQDGNGNPIDTHYYRYYTEGNYVRGLKMAFGPRAYARLTANVGSWEDASDGTVEPYAEQKFTYDSSKRVTAVTTQRAGSSTAGNPGLGTYSYSYSTSGNGDDFNLWKTKTVETLADDTTVTVYSNAYGQVLLRLVQPDGSANKWGTFYEYDGAGRLLTRAEPSAVTTVSGGNGDPVLTDDTTDYYLKSSSGLIHINEFHLSTDGGVDEETSGGVLGYLKSISVKRGTASADTETPLNIVQKYEYKSRTAGDDTIYLLGTHTSYGSSDSSGSGSNQRVTDYSYTFFSDKLQPKQITVEHPLISAGQHGPDESASEEFEQFAGRDTEVSIMDTYGRVMWTKDGDGFLTYTKRDDGTGAVIKFIQDVDTTNVGNEPDGWETPLGGGLHLVTEAEGIDGLGRITKLKDARGNYTYAVYLDTNHEVRTYPGFYDAGEEDFRTTGPIVVQREFRPSSGGQAVYTETLTLSVDPETTDDEPDGSETISAGNIASLARSITNNGDQIVQVDRYFSMSGISYSTTTASLGSSSNDSASGNRHVTLYGYDARGRLHRVQAPTGTITRTAFDALGRPTSTSVGTNDGGSSNMVTVQEYEYDGGGVGDGNLTEHTQKPGGGAADRVTQYAYDWRNRVVYVKQGAQAGGTESGTPDVQRVIHYRVYSNLDEVTEEHRYDGDNINTSSVPDSSPEDGIPDAPAAARLREKMAYEYDDRGRVFKQTRFAVTYEEGGSPGATVGGGSDRDFYYDHRGNLAAEFEGGAWISASGGGGGFQKNQDSNRGVMRKFDGAGRITVEATVNSTPVQYGWMFIMAVNYDDAWYDELSTGFFGAVATQSEYQYDENGNVIFTIRKDRHHDATGWGQLNDARNEDSPAAREYYTEGFYDRSNRLIATVELGTYGGTGLSAPVDGSIPARSATKLVTSYEYDSSGRLQSVTDPKDIETRYEHDKLGRTIKTVANYVNGTPSADDDQTTAYTYDGSDHVLTMKADLPGTDQTTQYIYGLSQSIAVIEVSAGTATATTTTAHGYKVGQSVSVSGVAVPDYNGTWTVTAVTSNTFSFALGGSPGLAIGSGTARPANDVWSNDILSAVRYPDKSSGAAAWAEQETLTYNALGQRKSFADRNGNVHSYAYDVVGRLTSDTVTTLGSGVNGAVRRMGFTYDSAARPFQFTSYSDTAGTNVVNQVRREYDGNGQLQIEYQEHNGAVNTGNSLKVKYGVDSLDDVNYDTMTYPNGRILAYNYDFGKDRDFGRVSSISDANGVLESYTYLGFDTVVKRAHPETGVDLTYISPDTVTGDAGDQYIGLDRFGRIVDQRWIDDGTDTDRFQYGYDENGNVKYKENLVSATNSELYSYDNLDRLTDFARGTLNGGKDEISSNLSRTQEWTLDALGNWSSLEQGTGGGTTMQNRTHNAQNQVTAVGGSSLTFDASGSMLTDNGGGTLTYDAWNRLATYVTFLNVVEEFLYDALGRRVIESVDYSGVTGFGEFGEEAIVTDLYYSQDWQVIEERLGANAKAQYTWSTVYVDAMVLRDRDSDQNGSLDERMYVAHDANFNVTALIDTDGEVVERFKYDPYGVATAMTGEWGAQLPSGIYGWIYLHQGGRLNRTAGLYHFRYRDYSPSLGRWVQQDPIRYLDGMNLYTYERENPVSKLDWLGLGTIVGPGQEKPLPIGGGEEGAPEGGSVTISSTGGSAEIIILPPNPPPATQPTDKPPGESEGPSTRPFDRPLPAPPPPRDDARRRNLERARAERARRAKARIYDIHDKESITVTYRPGEVIIARNPKSPNVGGGGDILIELKPGRPQP